MPLPTTSTVPRPQAQGYNLRIGTTLYQLSVGPGRQVDIQNAPLEAPRVNFVENAQDLGPDFGQVFSRSDFSGGEGLDIAHQRDADPRSFSRYWDSRNVDVSPPRPGQPTRIRLLHDTSQRRSSAGVHRLARIGTTLYMTEADTVVRWADPIAGAPTVEDPTPSEGVLTVNGLAALGDELYAAVGSGGIHQRSNVGVWSHWSDLTPGDQVWSVKGRVLAAAGVELYEARAAAGSLLLHTLANGESWTDVVDAGGAILASATDGYIYSFTEEQGELLLKGQTLLEGETPYSLGVVQGVVFIGSGQTTTAGGKIGRLWRASVVGVRLRDAQLIRTWGDGTATLDHTPRHITGSRDSAWTAVLEDGTETHVWRYYLETAAMTRNLVFGASGISQGLERIDDRLLVAIDGSGLWVENTTFAATGWLIGPFADFFQDAPKPWIGARLETDALPGGGGEQVQLLYSTVKDAILDDGDGSWTVAITIASGQQTTEQVLAGVTSRGLGAQVKLTAGTAGATTPDVYAYAFRAYPAGEDVIVSVPVNVSDQIERPGRQRIRLRGWGEQVWADLKAKEGDQAEIEVYRPSEKIRGIILSVSTPITGYTKRGSPTLYSNVAVRGRRIP